MTARQTCIEVKYEVEDGYVGGPNRPQSFMLCEEDLFDGSLDPTEEGVIELIETMATSDMFEKAAAVLRNRDSTVAWAMARIEERTL